MANQHSVSQFLTRPWQRRRDPEHKLVYYNFDTDKIEASLKNGVLTVTLPKTAEAQKPAKKIEVKPTT